MPDPLRSLTAGAAIVGPPHGLDGAEWNFLGQTYVPKALTASSFAWHATFHPGTSVPLHLHEAQDKFLLVLEGRFDLLIDGHWRHATQSDLVTLPRGVSHAVFNKSRHICKCLFWVAPALSLPAFFEGVHEVADQSPDALARLGAAHGIRFLAG
ncbi:cupin domain-containing protein [Lutibaculum baratangense]|uniref:cupin domain-containing protein n=1 Tax=Lutibaculum baratangense TaxID=1358440 RepID=UPI001FCB8280|nr:cupin domain-containing protein [Lutibaculum baratangense]